jgi:hypothetical protein
VVVERLREPDVAEQRRNVGQAPLSVLDQSF